MSLADQEPKFDQSFDAIYAQLRDRIPRYNPQWTNFNDADPGITLLQLFAWLAEMTLHSMNNVPRKNYLKFAELLALELQPALPAIVQLVFTPKASEPPDLIPERARYSGRAGASTVIFETIEALGVIGATLAAMVVFGDGTITPLALPAPPIATPFWPLGRNPAINDALYLGFKPNAGNPTPFPDTMRFLALRPSALSQGAAQQIGNQNLDLVPPVTLVWEYLVDAADDVWQALDTYSDATTALTRDGYFDVEGPQDIQPAVDASLQQLFPDPMYWIRLRLDANTYPTGKAPQLDFLVPNAVDAVNMVTELPLPFEASSGTAGQVFTFPYNPIDPTSLALEITPPDGATDDSWTAKSDFFSSGPDDKHYVLNPTAGTITFGDGVNGYIPPAGSTIEATVWRHGGGAAGNDVLAGAVTTIVQQVAGIDSVINPRAAAGGADEESIDHFIANAPYYLRSNGRLVTAADFEYQAGRISGVKKAKALGGRHPDYPEVTVPGAITVYVVSDSGDMPPAPSAELIRSVCNLLDPQRLITTEVYVAGPAFLEVRIEARILAAPAASLDQVRLDAQKRLNTYLDPIARDFGQTTSSAAIYAQLYGTNIDNAVHSIDSLAIYLNGQAHDIGQPITVGADSLIYPGDHLIVVLPDPTGGN